MLKNPRLAHIEYNGLELNLLKGSDGHVVGLGARINDLAELTWIQS